MTITKYRTNLNCGNCVAAVKPHLDNDPAIRRWSVDTADPNKVLTIEGDNIAAATVARHVADAGFKVLGPIETSAPVVPEQRTFLEVYRPLFLVLAYLVGMVALVELRVGPFDWMRAMRHFMGGFFVAFSFFKLLDLRGFANSYQSYDVIARRVPAYGLVYPSIELALGVAYLVNFAPTATNAVTLVVMLLGLAGVTTALLQKRTIQCACLGTVFNLPMSKVTFIEDALMAGMALFMLTQ